MRNACRAAVLLGAMGLAGCIDPPHCEIQPQAEPCGTSTCQPGTYCVADAGPLSCSPAKPVDAPCTQDVECVSLLCRGPTGLDGGEPEPGACIPRVCF